MRSQIEVIEAIVHTSIVKTRRIFYNSFLKGIMAGIFIGLGAFGNIVMLAGLDKYSGGFARFMGAVVFPVGLIGIVILGLELFTSNCMNIMGVFHNKVSSTRFIRNLIIVYFGNFVGGILLAYITYRTGALNGSEVETLRHLVAHKINTDIFSLILKGIMCNILVVGAVMFAYYSKDVIGKIFAIWFPIMLFILLGYSHSVANMYYLSTGFIYFREVTVFNVLYNLSFVTIGNFIGGLIMVLILNIDRNEKN